MRIWDITRELRDCRLAPGCPAPRLETVSNMAEGAEYNYTHIHASLHTSTHCDAARHFVNGGTDIAHMALTHYVGPCYVMSAPSSSLITSEDLEKIPTGVARLLLRGGGGSHLSRAAAEALTERGVITVGTDAFSIGAPHNDTEVHVALLSKGVAVIENLDLENVEDGFYFLSAAPCKFGGAEAAFCRALLLSNPEIEAAVSPKGKEREGNHVHL